MKQVNTLPLVEERKPDIDQVKMLSKEWHDTIQSLELNFGSLYKYANRKNTSPKVSRTLMNFQPTFINSCPMSYVCVSLYCLTVWLFGAKPCHSYS